MEWHDASCVRVSSRASLPFGCEVFIVSNVFLGLDMWNNELGFFLFSSPSSCLIGVLYSVEGCALRLLQGGWDVSFSITLQNYCFFLISVAWQKDNTPPFVLHEGKVYFWGFIYLLTPACTLNLGGIWRKSSKNAHFHLLVSKKNCNFAGRFVANYRKDKKLWMYNILNVR